MSLRGKLLWLVLPIGIILGFLAFSVKAEAKYKTQSEKKFPAITVTLAGKTLKIPEIEGTFVYNGEKQGPDLNLPDEIIAIGELEETDAGVYEIIVKLKEPDKDTWEDGTTENKVLKWTIDKAKISLPEVTGTKRIYNGSEQGPEIASVDSTKVAIEGETATSNGEYSIRLSLKDDKNTEWDDGTSVSKTVPWGIYVCRIGEDYYTSVTKGFEQNRSTGELPITMLCNWKEEAVNAGGTDSLYLDGYTLTSEASTITNKGVLSISGPGSITAKGAKNNHLTPVHNEGQLTINSGTFEACHTGTLTGSTEVYAVQNDAGTMVINGGSFLSEGKGLVAEGICGNGGTTVVNGGQFTIHNASEGHGACAVWAEGGTIQVNQGTFNVQNETGRGMAFSGTAGKISVSGGASLVTLNTAATTPHTYARGTMEIEISGGEHTMNGKGEIFFAVTNDSATLRLSGGNMTLNQTSTGNYRVHGLLCSGGTIGLSGGTLTVNSAGSGDTIGAAVSFGSLALQGGTLNAISASGGPTTGLYMKEGTATINGTSLSVTAKNGTVIGIDKPGLGATVTITKGQMTLDGGNVTVGKGASTGSTIQITGSIENFPVSVTYTTGYSIGNFWSKTPKVETK